MKPVVGIFFGGCSAEHEVSLRSAQYVYSSLDRSKYTPLLIGVDKEGFWHQNLESFTFEGKGLSFFEACAKILPQIDIAFPVFHGPYGEDGSFQGLFEVAGIPYVGANVLGSAVGMDKDVSKRLLRDAGIPIADFLVFSEEPVFQEVVDRLGLPLFVKPVTMGSSVGLTRVQTREEFDKAVEHAFLYDTKIVIESEIRGREIECSVLETDQLMASLPGEFIPKGGVYTYEMNYIDPDGAKFILPAQLEEKKIREIQQMALKVFRILSCQGMARVDFFMDQDGTLYINEINTIPGFTSISLYPQLWELSGINGQALVTHLIEYAAVRSAEKKRIAVFV